MDGSDFDTLTRRLTTPHSRRSTLVSLLAAIFAIHDGPRLLAKKKGGGKKGGKKGKAKKKPCPSGTVACGGACRECCTNAHCAGSVGPLSFCRNYHCTPECASDEDCQLYLYAGAKPYCVAGGCRECRGNEHCPSPERPVCIGNTCRQCVADPDCAPWTPGLPVCVNNLCHECRSNADCPSGRPLCTGNLCVAHCGNGVLDGDESDVDCGGRCTKCANGKGCFEDADCQSGHCGSNGRCAECTDHAHCPDATPFCNGAGTCVRCVLDTDCPSNHRCQANQCVLTCPPEQPVYCARNCWPAGTVCCADDSDFGGEICPPDPEVDYVCYALEEGQRPSLCCPADWLCSPHECRPGGCD